MRCKHIDAHWTLFATTTEIKKDESNCHGHGQELDIQSSHECEEAHRTHGKQQLQPGTGRFWLAQSFQDSGTDCSNVGSCTYMHSFPTTVDHWTIAHVHKNPTNCKHACWPWPHPHKKGVGLQCRSNTLPTTAHCQVRHKANSTYVCMYVCLHQMDGINSRA